MNTYNVKKFWFWPIIGAAVAFGWLVQFGEMVRPEDLVQETVQRTNWRRPKQWKLQESTTSNDYSSTLYGDGLRKDGKSAAMVMLRQSTRPVIEAHATEQEYEQLRQMMLENTSLWQPTIEQIQATLQCKGTPSVAQTVDTARKNGMIEIMEMSATCQRDDDSFIIKGRILVGEADGLIRYITVRAFEYLWDKNGQAFHDMLSSPESTEQATYARQVEHGAL